jgi:hypothetical protein
VLCEMMLGLWIYSDSNCQTLRNVHRSNKTSSTLRQSYMHACSTLLLMACSAYQLEASVLDDVRLHPANEPRQQLR